MDLSKIIKISIVLQPEPLTVETYITKYLKPLIDEADMKGKRSLICRHSEHTVHYKSNNDYSSYLDGNLYGYKEKMGGYYRKNWNKLETDKDFYIPDHKDIAAKFKELGYELLLVDEKCFIINWSQMVKAETSVGIVQQNNSRGVAAGIAAYQELLKNKIKADLPAVLGDFFYSAIVQSMTAQEAIEIHFIHSVPGRVKCIKPPAKEFLNLTVVLNLLLDQRHILGYEIVFRTSEDQQTLIVMTFPLNAAHKMISNLQ